MTFQLIPHIKLKFLSDASKKFGTPLYATQGSAAIDLRACLDSNTSTLSVKPGERVLVPTGLSIHIDNPTIMACILPRSGLGHNKKIILGNGTGVIDSDYQGELKISVLFDERDFSAECFEIKHGDKIAQLVFVPVLQVKFDIVEDFESESERGHGGFGSTGIN